MQIDRNRLHDSLFQACFAAIAFLLPVFGRAIPAVIIIMMLNWIVDSRLRSNLKQLLNDRKRWALLSFSSIYIIYLLGMIHTTNYDYGWFDLEIKLSLLIFPLVFSTAPPTVFNPLNLKIIFVSLMAGCITGSLILLIHAALGAWGFRIPGYSIPGSFFYMKLSWYFHASYLAMYYNFTIAICLWYLTGQSISKVRVKAGLIAVILILTLMIFLLASKAGLSLLLVMVVLFTLRTAVKLRKPLTGFTILAAGILIFVSGYFLFPFSFSRIARAEKVLTEKPVENRVKSESNADRIAILRTGLAIVKENYLTGVGTGDVKDALLEGYREKNVIPALKLRLNAHDQYLQTMIALGIPGFLVLVLCLVIPWIYGFRRKDDLYMIFLILVGLNFLFESMLEVQAGVVFYAFFNALLFASLIFSSDSSLKGNLIADA